MAPALDGLSMADRGLTRLAGVVANVSWTSFEQMLRIGLSFLVTVQVINALGPERFGLYSYVISVVGILAPLTAFGLEQVVIRRLVERPADSARLLGTTFVIRMVCGVVAFLAALVVILVLDGGNGLRLRLTAVAGVMLLLQATDTVAFFFKAIMGAKHIALSRLAGLLSASGVTVVLLVTGGGVGSFLWMRALEAGVTGIALMLAYRWWGGKSTSWRFDGRECGRLLSAGFPLFIASFAVMVYMRVPQLMLGQLSTEEQLGYYGVAVRLAEVLNFVPVAIVTAFYPALVDCRARSPEAFRRKIQGLYNLMAAIGYVVAIGATVVAPLGFRILFGHRYDAALPMFNRLVWGMLFVCLGVAMNAMLTVIGRNWISAAATVAGMVVNVGLNFWLIPRLGAVGAAWAALASYWVSAHGVFLLLPEFHGTFAMIARALVWPDIRLLRPAAEDSRPPPSP
ncbi:MAG: flippase [Telmatospirillum sp.]|nr:flippase [Telmatospirillum sp.]